MSSSGGATKPVKASRFVADWASMSDDESLDFNRSPDLKFLETPQGEANEAPAEQLEKLDLAPAALPPAQAACVTPERSAKSSGISMLQATPPRVVVETRQAATGPSWRTSSRTQTPPRFTLQAPPGIPQIRSPSREGNNSDSVAKSPERNSQPVGCLLSSMQADSKQRRASQGSLGNSGDDQSDQGQSSGIGDSINGAGEGGLSPQAQKASKELKLNHSLPTNPPFSCFLGGIPQAWAEEQVAEFFQKEIQNAPIAIRMMAEKKTGKRKGFCYVDFENQDVLISALYLDQKVLEPDTNPIRVDVAEPPKPRKAKTPKSTATSPTSHVRSPRAQNSQARRSPRTPRNGFRSPRNGGLGGRRGRGRGRGRNNNHGNFGGRNSPRKSYNNGPRNSPRNDHRSPRMERSLPPNGPARQGNGDGRPAHLRQRFFRSSNPKSQGSRYTESANWRNSANIFGGAKPREDVLQRRGN